MGREHLSGGHVEARRTRSCCVAKSAESQESLCQILRCDGRSGLRRHTRRCICIAGWAVLACVMISDVCVASIKPVNSGSLRHVAVSSASQVLQHKGSISSSCSCAESLLAPKLLPNLELRAKSLSVKVEDRVVMADKQTDECKDIMEEIAVSAEESTCEWSEHFGQRYNDIVAPKYKVPLALKRSSGSFSAYSYPGEHCFNAGKSDAEHVLLLDLDKCSFFGNDINDLGICLQWMGRKHEEVVQLYRLLLSPCVLQMYETLKAQHKNVRVVIYTARATLINYRSAFRADKVISVAWNPKWRDDGQVYFPGSLANAAEIMSASADGLEEMVKEEREDLQKALERLLAARQVICEALGLSTAPEVVVTATPKDVERTVRRLGYSTRHAYLWDDNERLRGASGVLTVPPFVRLPAAQRAAAVAFLSERLPAGQLEPDLVEFMLGADPSDCALVRAADGTLEYQLPESPDGASPEPWPLPLPAAPTADEWDDCASSVTPGNEVLVGGGGACAASARGGGGGAAAALGCGVGGGRALERVPSARQPCGDAGARSVR